MIEGAEAKDFALALASVQDVAPASRVGFDAVHMPTWHHHLKVGGPELVERIYRAAEIAFCGGRLDRLSARFAAKEAVLKCLGTGIRGSGLLDVEIMSEPEGRPTVRLHGPSHDQADSLGLGRIEVSLCHEHDFAFAVAMGIEEGKR